jgi:hypothetical protein
MSTTGHIHLSVLSVVSVMAVVVLTSFLMHQASLKLISSDSEKQQLWGKAIAAGFGF